MTGFPITRMFGLVLMMVFVEVAGLAAGTAQASTTLLSLDINKASAVENYGPAAAVLSLGSNDWNYLNASGSPASFTAANLADSNGNPTTVTWTYTAGALGADAYSGGSGGNALLDDYIYDFVFGGAAGTFTITNLQPSGTYDLVIYSTRSGGGGTFAVSGTGGGTLSTTGGAAPFASGTNYVEFAAVVADGSGTITTNVSGFIPVINGFQIEGPLPEPASLSLLAIAVAPLMLRRRRA